MALIGIGLLGNGGSYGGGRGGGSTNGSAYGGGALAYSNGLSVTPGTSYTVNVVGNGAVRIVWGTIANSSRTFPSTQVSQKVDELTN
jgi:hypothetical protein